MVCDDTLRIKNLPKELSELEKEEFLRHFGATQVKILTSHYKGKSTAYAKFSTKEAAKSVMLRLHQVSILNSRLCIEFAEQDLTENKLRQKEISNSETKNRTHFKKFINRLTAWNSTVSFSQPPPPHLKYEYPNPNRATINNIAHALASVPKFYTQVLHLMNRMNLPPPFSDVPDPPQTSQRFNQAMHTSQQVTKPKEDSSESELESDSESSNLKEIIPKKRTLPQKKVVKRPKFIKPLVASQGVTKSVVDKPEDVFDKVDIQTQKKIEVKVSADSLENKTLQNVENIGAFGIMEAVTKVPDETEEEVQLTEQLNTCITEKELNSNKIPDTDLSVLSVFKNYHPGAPTCRLYIKNIAKTVNVKDLEFIYKRYVEETDENRPSQFDVRLMQEGKMKGQAFITLDSVPLAQRALKETNVALVIIAITLLFTFGFKSSEQPPFDKLSALADDRKSAGKKRKIKEKKSANGNAVQISETKSEKSKDTKHSPTKEAPNTPKTKKQEPNSPKVAEKKKVDTSKPKKSDPVEEKNKKNLKPKLTEKPVDYDEGNWETVPSKNDKKKKQESPKKEKAVKKVEKPAKEELQEDNKENKATENIKKEKEKKPKKDEKKEEVKVNESAPAQVKPGDSPKPAFDEIGDVWTEAKAAKKSKKKSRREN
ncbi:hypothetical protein FQR65_LT05773 [Abscondita terminalis]|nr:hypothetical protein FQR65_LT05773 [Abscondita terminalis]